MTLDILMPFYGRVDQFKLAVESVLAQSNGDWRLTIIDDSYPDQAPGVWASHIADARVRYLRNDTNLGVSGNFRRCVRLMEQEHAVIMGCDDIMLPEFVNRFAELSARFPGVAIIQPGVAVINDQGRLSTPLADRVKSFYRPAVTGAHLLGGERLATSLSRGNWAYFPSLVWSVPLIREIGFRNDLEVALDLALLLEITARGGELVLDDLPVFQYRRHEASVSAFTAADGTRFIEEREVLLAAAARFTAMGWRRAARAANLHLSSRLNAASVLLRAGSGVSASDRRLLVGHVLGRRGPADLSRR
jgi:glycosyltransferase involved in cell wall biosynthesis